MGRQVYLSSNRRGKMVYCDKRGYRVPRNMDYCRFVCKLKDDVCRGRLIDFEIIDRIL